MSVSEKHPPGRRVVALQADPATSTALREWAGRAGFDLGWSHSGWPQHSEHFDFHVTVIATANAVSLDVGARPLDPLRLHAAAFGTLGEGGRVPVLLLAENEKLTAIRNLFLSLGCEPTYADFVPHVSLSYRWSGSPDISALPMPDFPLVFNWLTVSALEDRPAVVTADAAVAGAVSASCRDAATIAGTRKTTDGYLVTEARCARTGIQDYAGHEVGRPDMPVVKVYRPEGEVFARQALASYAFRPATLGHPVEGVTADNWKKEAVGHTGGEISRDGGFVRVPLVLMDASAIAAVEGGLREISMGYDCRLDWTPGTTPDGQAYDAVQRDLRMNHLALVERGRAGPACRVGDGARPKQGAKQTGVADMEKVTVDGIGYEVTEQIAELVAKLQNDVKAATDAAAKAAADLEAATKARDAAIGERDAVRSQVPTADALDKMAAERSACIAAAKALCPELVADGKSLPDIRAHVVAARLGDAAVAGRSADYIAAAFDTLAAAGGGRDPVADALRQGVGSVTAADAASKARSDYVAGLSKGYLGA